MDHFEEELEFDCPYCSAGNTLFVDLTGGAKQQFVHDCETCCHPILIKLDVTEEGIENFSAEKE